MKGYEMMAYCGLDCEKCPAYIATKNNDIALRRKVAKEWGLRYNIVLDPDDINCTGCAGEGPKVYYCQTICAIRKCALERNANTCAECNSMPCEKLNQILTICPQAKENLESLRKSPK